MFQVRHPVGLGEVSLSVPSVRRVRGDEVTLTASLDDFRPEGELVLTW